MRIALAPCAAGEGETHPSGLPLFSTDTTNLPWIILRAVHRAARLEGVSPRARAVLCALARTVDAANPFGEIYARRTLLTERAMQSERTFYRSLADLDSAGLIARAPQRRYVEAGLFGRAYLHLTRKAALLLGLIDEPGQPAVSNEGKQGGCTDAQAFQRPYAKVADGANTKDLSPLTSQERQPGQVPQDLQRLRTLGFLDFLIFKLMRQAREAGKRLSDVVEVCWQHLRQAKRPINYLRALLASTTDFGHQLSVKMNAITAVQTATHKRNEAETLVRKLDGRTFADADGTTRYTVADGGTALLVCRVAERVTRRSAGHWAEAFAAALKKGQIVPAEQEDFAARTPETGHDVGAAGHVKPHQPRELTRPVSEHLIRLRALCRRA
ncbi:conserved hypothetical protein [Burkholderia sp. 8Y]|uniref:hypothetical protein n=1 Tax=Burkholderia sp. 8Y TaxID=2653133 RepID=UPI0012F3392E|nr:hypothetical protein [Burkholderia sp. 8Y]VXC81946.1 conserved hypothetical protein [Burkholderia sp. 8Y]